MVDEVISPLDLAPTLLDAAGIAPPANMKGHSVLPLANDIKGGTILAWVSTPKVLVGSALRCFLLLSEGGGRK